MIKAAFTLALVAALAGCAERPNLFGGASRAQSNVAPSGANTPQERRGLFSAFAREHETVFAAEDLDQMDVAFEATVPFGTMARVCGAKGKPLGNLVGTSSVGDFKIYDTAPAGVAVRKFYLTGFADACPRQFMAATAVFGAPSKYEALHYGEDKGSYIYGATDAAYDKIKENTCGVPAGEPCGRKIRKIDGHTTFLSAYELAEESERWTDFLIHNGSVVATALKTKQTLPTDQ